MYKTEKVNNIKIKPLIIQKFDPKTVHGYDFFPNPYNNVGLISRTRGGKTNCICNILQATVKPKTNVMIFCPTVNTDKTYAKMKSILKEKKCNLKTFEHFIENGVNHLTILVDELLKKDKKEEQGKERHGVPKIELNMDEILFTHHPSIENVSESSVISKPQPKSKPQKQKKGKLAPEWIIIIDDLSSLCRDPSITRILCKSRHMKMRIFISIHNITDLQPAAWGQLANILLFPNINRERIEQVAEKCGLSFKEDSKKNCVLWNLYEDATKQDYQFLNCNPHLMTFHKNFDEKYQV